jgi:hypothetical protein
MAVENIVFSKTHTSKKPSESTGTKYKTKNLNEYRVLTSAPSLNKEEVVRQVECENKFAQILQYLAKFTQFKPKCVDCSPINEKAVRQIKHA